MGRLSTIPEDPRSDAPPILSAVEQWEQKCLLSDGSVFSTFPLWTISNLAILDEHFIKNPITGEQPFLEKFRLQLEATPGPVKKARS